MHDPYAERTAPHSEHANRTASRRTSPLQKSRAPRTRTPRDEGQRQGGRGARDTQDAIRKGRAAAPATVLPAAASGDVRA